MGGGARCRAAMCCVSVYLDPPPYSLLGVVMLLVIFMREAGSVAVLWVFTVLLIVITLLPFLCRNRNSKYHSTVTAEEQQQRNYNQQYSEHPQYCDRTGFTHKNNQQHNNTQQRIGRWIQTHGETARGSTTAGAATSRDLRPPRDITENGSNIPTPEAEVSSRLFTSPIVQNPPTHN